MKSGRLMSSVPGRSTVERANDSALEWAILGARWGGLLVALCAVAAFLAYVWTGDERWASTGLLAAVIGGGAGWWGWWAKGNEDWRG